VGVGRPGQDAPSAVPHRVGAHYVVPMPYPTKLLNENEEVVADLHPHWWHFAEPAAALLGSILFGIVVLTVTDDGTARNALMWIALFLIIGTAGWLVARYVGWVSTNFVVTNQRVVFRSGLMTKRGIEIPLDRVVTVHFKQNIFERMIDAGDLLIESAGELGQQRFTDVRDPVRVQRLIAEQAEMREQSKYGSLRNGPGTSDVATQLEKLEGMMERGTLTREEFEAQKRRLLES
jgi:uncharacterized membrane protein YdbT with pleckstrin-like domain